MTRLELHTSHAENESDTRSLVLPEHQALQEATLTLSNTRGNFLKRERTIRKEVTNSIFTAVNESNVFSATDNVGTTTRTSNVQEEERTELIVVYVRNGVTLNGVTFCNCYALHASNFQVVRCSDGREENNATH